MQSLWLQPAGNILAGRIALGWLAATALWLSLERPLVAATQIHNQSATPATISFLATDPDSPTLSVPVTVSFRTTGANTTRTWQLDVQATSGANMASCPNAIPVSQIQVSCVS